MINKCHSNVPCYQDVIINFCTDCHYLEFDLITMIVAISMTTKFFRFSQTGNLICTKQRQSRNNPLRGLNGRENFSIL